jgi:hypothetical protein
MDMLISGLNEIIFLAEHVGKTTCQTLAFVWRTEKPISLGTVRRLRYTEKRRTFNFAGIYTDEFGKTRFTIMKT